MSYQLSKQVEEFESNEASFGVYSDKLKFDKDLIISNKNYHAELRELILNNVKPISNEIPTTYEFAHMASLAYQNLQAGHTFDNLPGWKFLTSAFNNKNRFHASVFYNLRDRQIVIAHRGTYIELTRNLLSDIKVVLAETDIQGIFGNNFVTAMNSACTLAHTILEALNLDDEETKISNWNICLTGHSLGGWLSQITAFSLKYMKLKTQEQVFLASNETDRRYDFHTEVFESPGCKNMLKKIKDKFFRRYEIGIKLKSLDITTFLSSPNIVNCCNIHVGKIFRIFPKVSDLSKYPILYLLNSHNMENILKILDKETGWFTKHPNGLSEIKEVIDWPQIELKKTLFPTSLFGDEYEDFFRKANQVNHFVPVDDDQKLQTTRYKTKLFPGPKQSTTAKAAFEALECIHYIKRTFIQKTVLRKDFFENLSIDDKIGVAGDYEDIFSIPGSVKKVQTDRDFNVLCEEYTKKNVHWLELQSDRFRWKQTRGYVTNIRKYLDETIQNTYPEEKLLSQKSKHTTLIISAEPGMGKSTVLSSLTRHFSKDSQQPWIFLVNLNDSSVALKKALIKEIKFSKDNPIQAIDFFINEILPSNHGTKLNNLEKRLLRKYFSELGGVVLLIDAFDEICPDYDDLVVNLIETLQKTKVDKIILTTRPHKREVLENYFSTFSFTMKPLQFRDIITFIVQFCELHLPVYLQDRKNLDEYAKISLKMFSESIKEQGSTFTGIPLHCRLLAEFMVDKLKNGIMAVPQTLNLYDLYKHFVDEKFKIHDSKSPDSKGSTYAKTKDFIFLSSLQKFHTKYAMQILLSEEINEELDFQVDSYDDNEITWRLKEDIIKMGLIQEIEGKIQMKHQSYAEYLIFDYVLKLCKQVKPNNKKLKTISSEVLLNPQFGVIRFFIDSFMTSDSVSLNPFFSAHAEVISKNWKSSKQICFNENEDTVLHVLLREKILHSFYTVYNLIRKHCDRETFLTLINASNKDGNTALHISAFNGKFNALSMLIDSGANVDATNNEKETPIHLACRKGQDIIVQKLIESKCDIKCSSETGMTPLLEASEYGNEKIISLLIRSGSDITFSNNNGWSAIHYASKHDFTDLVNQLMDKSCDINVTTNEGQHPLHLVAAEGNLDLLNIFIGKGCDVNITDNKGWTALHFAAVNGKSNVIYSLIDNDCDINALEERGWSALHYLSSTGNALLTSYLLKNGHTIMPNNAGLLPLHIAAGKGYNDVVEIYFKNGSEVDARDKIGRSALHHASAHGQTDTVRFLLEKGCDIKACTNRLFSSLHQAAELGYPIVASFLIKNGSDINGVTIQKHTPLHVASQFGFLEVVKVLIENKCLVDEPDEDDWTPLHLASLRGHKQIVSILLDNGANIEALSKGSNETPLHFAAKRGHFSTLSLLISRKANANARNSNNKIALDLAVENGHAKAACLLSKFNKP